MSPAKTRKRSPVWRIVEEGVTVLEEEKYDYLLHKLLGWSNVKRYMNHLHGFNPRRSEIRLQRIHEGIFRLEDYFNRISERLGEDKVWGIAISHVDETLSRCSFELEGYSKEQLEGLSSVSHAPHDALGQTLVKVLSWLPQSPLEKALEGKGYYEFQLERKAKKECSPTPPCPTE